MVFNNLVYTYCQILNSYKINNNTLPEHVTVNRWSTVSNLNTKFATPNQILNATNTIVSYVEQHNALPSSVHVGNVSVGMATYLRLITNAVWNVQGNLNTTIPIKTYTTPILTAETVTNNVMYSEEYLNVVKGIIDNFDLYEHVIDIAITSNGKLGFNNTIYIYSQILYSYNKTNNTLPDMVTVTPWSTIKNHAHFFKLEQVQTASNTVKDRINTDHMLPETVAINGVNVDMPSFLKILARSVRNTQNYLYASVLYESVNPPTHPWENITVPGTLDHKESLRNYHKHD